MKEIDFLPEWYKQGRIARVKHREFYITMSLVIFFMGIWSVYANGRVAIVKARNEALQKARIEKVLSEAEYDSAERKYQQLEIEQKMLDSVKSRITVSNVIAELTHLLDSGVVMKKLSIKAEEFSAPNNESEVEAVSFADQAEESNKSIRFKITINGLASDASEVAKMVNKLEQSDYFFQVVPGYSRNTTTGQYHASEFEIMCYLSNYRLES
ncbi:MAG: PilN domain-containing protein [Sedimentisphaerales bacterium]|nr:PilN domain-containing protein [Sedimentisphaerales bacterium]